MDRQYVGIDLHRRRSVLVRLSASGERLGVHRVDNAALEFAAVMAEAGDAVGCQNSIRPWTWEFAACRVQELCARVSCSAGVFVDQAHWG